MDVIYTRRYGMSVKKDTYKIQAQTIIKNLARRNMEGF